MIEVNKQFYRRFKMYKVHYQQHKLTMTINKEEITYNYNNKKTLLLVVHEEGLLSPITLYTYCIIYRIL